MSQLSPGLSAQYDGRRADLTKCGTRKKILMTAIRIVIHSVLTCVRWHWSLYDMNFELKPRIYSLIASVEMRNNQNLKAFQTASQSPPPSACVRSSHWRHRFCDVQDFCTPRRTITDTGKSGEGQDVSSNGSTTNEHKTKVL